MHPDKALLALATAIVACLPASYAVISPDDNDVGLEACTAEQQLQILPQVGLTNCEPRPTVVPLELPNATYVHMTPRHVEVNRCGGSCQSRYHNCIPLTTTTKSFDILMIRHSAASGATPSECATAHVEEHTSCGCGCSTSAEDCSPVQLFVSQECRCVCADDSARAECLSSGRYWNPVSCSCMCRNPVTFPTCPTGYYFDSDNACTCVPLGASASTILEIVVLLLTASCIVLLYASYRLLRKRVDNASPERRNIGDRSISELRTLFTQLSRQPPASNVDHQNDALVGDDGAPAADCAEDGSNYMPSPMRPRASTFSFFPLRGYEEIGKNRIK